MKRPDLFLPANNASLGKIARVFGAKPNTIDKYLDLVERLLREVIAAAIGLGVVAGAAGLATFGSERTADAAIVERVVAVVGERPILMSDLRHRARPHLIAIAAQNPTPAQQAAAESEKIREPSASL